MTAPAPTDEQLMAAYVAGEYAAFRALFARHAPTLLGTMRRHQLSESDACDVVQTAFLQLHRARNDFRGDSKLKPWLYTIAYNLMRDHYRRRTRRPEDPLDAAAGDNIPATGNAPDARILGAAVRRALARLPDKQREVIVLHWYEGFSFPEISQVVGAGLSAVKVRAHRGYARLRELLPREVTVGAP